MMNHDNALRNLVDVTQILSKHNVTHWIQNGTLLGLYREGTFIKHDTDIDLGLLAKTFTIECYKEILKNDFQVKHIFGFIENSFEITLSRNDVRVDLFFHYVTNGLQYHCIFDDWTPLSYRRYDYRYKPFKAKRKTYLDTELFVPEDELAVLEANYGVDWKTPKKRWDIARSPSNVYRTDIVLSRSECTLAGEKYLNSI